MGIGVPELLARFVLWLVLLAAVVWGLYWLLRLAVRHGTLDARRKLSVHDRDIQSTRLPSSNMEA